MASGYHHLLWSSFAQSKCAKSCQELPAEKWRLANLPKTHRGTAPWWEQHPLKTEGPYLKPHWSSTAQSKCAKSHQEPPAVHHPHESGGAGLLSPLAQIPLKTEPGLICLKLTGDLHHGRGYLPWRWQVPTTISRGAVQVWVNVPNHVRSCWLKNEGWPICLKLTHSRDCLPWRWQVPTTIPQGAVQAWVNVPNHVRSRWPGMMHHPGQGRAGRTLVLALPLKNWTQANPPETHRGPLPW